MSVLAPSGRTLLGEALRPPLGYRFDGLVGTTWSLDLLALLTIPFAVTRGELGPPRSSGRIEALPVLEALRRHARDMVVFCEEGRMGSARNDPLLFAWLEKVAVGALAPKGGAFHAKVLAVRYVADDADPVWADDGIPEDTVRYRVLCGTRNLAFHRSWDTLLVLEGDVPKRRRRAHARNRPLAAFLRALPGCAVHQLPPEKSAFVGRFADDLLRTDLRPPEPFWGQRSDLAFVPLGLPGLEEAPLSVDVERWLVVAPFVDSSGLRRFISPGRLKALVSRPEALDRLKPGDLKAAGKVYVLADALEQGEDAGAAEESARGAAAAVDSLAAIEQVGADPGLLGLHAKLYVGESARHAWLWTGSANATKAAFSKNLEFLVGLRGPTGAIGIDALLRGAGNAPPRGEPPRLGHLLSEYLPPEEPLSRDKAQEEFDELMDDARRAVAESRLSAHVASVQTGTFDVEIRAEAAGHLPASARCSIRPMGRPATEGAVIARLEGVVARFPGLPFEALSGFSLVHVQATVAREEKEGEFVMGTPLRGEPEDRPLRLLHALLSTPGRLHEFLALLLGDPFAGTAGGHGGRAPPAGGADFPGAGADLPLLETLLRAAVREPDRLRAVDGLLADLAATEQGKAAISADLRSIWEAIRPTLSGVAVAGGALRGPRR